MSRYRNVALGVGVWLLVVTGGAVLVWTVISQAGQGVAGTPTVAEGGSQGTARPSPKPSSNTPQASPSPDSGTVRGTWSGAGGVLIAECAGREIALIGATPSSGWKFEVDDRGPDLVRVEFETSDERTRVRVEGVCADGAPSFAVDTRTKG